MTDLTSTQAFWLGHLCPLSWAKTIDRDINAARNIQTAGLAGLACGATGAGAAA